MNLLCSVWKGGTERVSAWLFLLQQSVCAWSLLLSLGLSIGLRKPHGVRLTLTALACGAAALVCILLNGAWLQVVGVLGISLLAPTAAWPGLSPSRRWSMALSSLILTLLMAGESRLLHTMGLRRMPLVLAQFALLPVLIMIIPRATQARCISVEITLGNRSITLTALVDSGNLLRDPITRLPVIVISRKVAAQLLASDVFSPGMRLISVRTVAGSALMSVFRPTRVRLLLSGGWQEVRAIIGQSPRDYSGYQALVPASVITSSQGGISICP